MMNHTTRISSTLLHFALFCMCLLMGMACSKSDGKTSSDSLKILELQRYFVEHPEILEATRFTILDTEMVVIERKLDNNQVKIIDKESQEVLMSFGRKGRGPNEFSAFIQPLVANTNNIQIQLLDWSNRRLDLFEIEKVAEDLKAVKQREFRFDDEFLMPQKAIFLDETKLAMVGDVREGLVAIHDTQVGNTVYHNPIEQDLSELSNRQKGYLFDSDIAVNFEAGLMAVAPNYLPRLDIVDFNGELVASYALPDEELRIDDIGDLMNKKGYFFGVSATKDYIYAAYVGMSMNEMDEVIEKNEPKNVNYTKLYKFTWQGEFVESYQLNGGSYRRFEIDESTNRVYSLDLFTSEIVYFEMGE